VAILRPMITPTAGIPQAVVASRRPRNMSQREFYDQGVQRSQQQLDPRQLNPQLPSQQPNDGTDQFDTQFEQQPLTGDYIAEQLSRMNSRTAPPELEPIARVKSPAAELVQPSTFQTYYDRLDSIRGVSTARSASAQAGANRMSGSNTTGNRSSGGGQSYGNPIPSNPQANFKFAQQLGSQFGWNDKELQAWYTLGMKESGWRNNAQNPHSTAFGIGQFLDSTWKGVGMSKTSDPAQQVLAMAKYIKNRYGSPSKALAFHISHNWY
jgi:hypothetical protein